MEFRYDEVENDVLIIVADGGLNAQTAEEFVSDVEKLVDAGLSKIIIDCSQLTYISSYGLGVLLRLHRSMREHGGDVKMSGVRGIIPQTLQATNLDKVFQLYPDVSRARLAFRPRTDTPT